MTPAQFSALCERKQAADERVWAPADAWGSVIAAQQVNWSTSAAYSRTFEAVQPAYYLRQLGRRHVSGSQRPAYDSGSQGQEPTAEAIKDLLIDAWGLGEKVKEFRASKAQGVTQSIAQGSNGDGK